MRELRWRPRCPAVPDLRERSEQMAAPRTPAPTDCGPASHILDAAAARPPYPPGTVPFTDQSPWAPVLRHARCGYTAALMNDALATSANRRMALARIGRLVLPFLPLMRDADEQVARLVGLHADDAARRSGCHLIGACVLRLRATYGTGPRSTVARHRAGRPRHRRQSRPGPRRGGHRLGAAGPPAAGPGRATGPRTPAAASHRRRRTRPDPGSAGPGSSRACTRARTASTRLADRPRRKPASRTLLSSRPVLFHRRPQRPPGSRR